MSFLCDFDGCSKSFSSRFCLRRHQLTHEKVRKFVCEVCSRAFSLPQYLKEHSYIHSGQRPFVCKFANCGKAFRQAGKLSLHTKKHKRENVLASPACSDAGSGADIPKLISLCPPATCADMDVQSTSTECSSPASPSPAEMSDSSTPQSDVKSTAASESPCPEPFVDSRRLPMPKPSMAGGLPHLTMPNPYAGNLAATFSMLQLQALMASQQQMMGVAAAQSADADMSFKSPSFMSASGSPAPAPSAFSPFVPSPTRPFGLNYGFGMPQLAPHPLFQQYQVLASMQRHPRGWLPGM